MVFTSVGLMVGSLFWRWVFTHSGVRGMLVGCALMSALAALICIVTEIYEYWSLQWVHGIVLFLATVAYQAIFAAGISWVSAFAGQQDRATLIGFGALVVAVQSTVLGAILGAIAHNSEAIWPVVIVLVLNLLAAAAAVKAPTASVLHDEPDEPHA